MQWNCYKDLLSTDPIILDFTKGQMQHGITFHNKPINSHSDALKLHQALDEGNFDYYYRKVPKWAIELAVECCGNLANGSIWFGEDNNRKEAVGNLGLETA